MRRLRGKLAWSAAARMCLGREKSVSWVREMLTERVRCSGIFLAAVKTARRRFPVSCPLRPVSSANGMNSLGGMRPRTGCCQRARTSNPLSRPVRSSTSGWKYGMISFFSSALRRSFASSAAMARTILRPGCKLHRDFLTSPASDEIPGGGGPVGEGEVEAAGEQTARDDLTAFEDELGFGAQEEGADLEHPCCCRQTDSSAPCFAEDAEEVAIGERIWRGEVDWAGD